MADEPSSTTHVSAVKTGGSGGLPKKPLRKVFSRDELWHYGVAAVIYITLGVLFQDVVLNFVVGPLFIVLWMWWIPPLVDKWRAWRS